MGLSPLLASAALGVFAALINLPVRETAIVRPAVADRDLVHRLIMDELVREGRRVRAVTRGAIADLPAGEHDLAENIVHLVLARVASELFEYTEVRALFLAH